MDGKMVLLQLGVDLVTFHASYMVRHLIFLFQMCTNMTQNNTEQDIDTMKKFGGQLRAKTSKIYSGVRTITSQHCVT